MPPEREYPGVLQIRQMPRSFCLGEFQDLFEVGDAHLFIFEDQVQYSEPRFIGTCLENLGTKRQIETF